MISKLCSKLKIVLVIFVGEEQKDWMVCMCVFVLLCVCMCVCVREGIATADQANLTVMMELDIFILSFILGN